jgi:hypothetical protein
VPEDARFCSRRCRQAAFRARRRRTTVAAPGAAPGLRFLYLDPPYPNLARRYYKRERLCAEVDHSKLIRLAAGFDGWALSTSEAALRSVLELCPPGVHVGPWVKPIGVPPATFGRHTAWEPVIFFGGRAARPGVRDWLSAQPARMWGKLPGRKPLAFAAWVFDMLGMIPGDELLDAFPGTGGISRAWSEISRGLNLPVDGRRHRIQRSA